ncbi:OmpA family protein [Saccharothrix sp. Mg75]|uniref:OmpA family protein n=1 Tax=Saccharothrix sp. Mg75 TaxID=3445357 RepID=UPI003EEC4BD3
MPALLAASGVYARARQVGSGEGVAPAAGRLVVLLRGDEVVLSGGAADDGERLALVNAIRAKITSVRVTDLVTPNGDQVPVEHGPVVDVLSAAAGSGDLTAVFERDRAEVTGVVHDEAAAGRVRESAARWGTSDVVVEAPGGEALDVTAFQRSITSMVQGNGGFRFEPGTAAWQGHGPVLVDRVGRLLLVAPRTAVTLVGHASAEHPEAAGLAATRAVMVRDLFVAQGVRPDRIVLSLSVDPVPEGVEPAARQVDVLVRHANPR